MTISGHDGRQYAFTCMKYTQSSVTHKPWRTSHLVLRICRVRRQLLAALSAEYGSAGRHHGFCEVSRGEAEPPGAVRLRSDRLRLHRRPLLELLLLLLLLLVVLILLLLLGDRTLPSVRRHRRARGGHRDRGGGRRTRRARVLGLLVSPFSARGLAGRRLLLRGCVGSGRVVARLERRDRLQVVAPLLWMAIQGRARGRETVSEYSGKWTRQTQYVGSVSSRYAALPQ